MKTKYCKEIGCINSASKGDYCKKHRTPELRLLDKIKRLLDKIKRMRKKGKTTNEN